MEPSIPTDENVLYRLSRGDLLAHARAAQQMADAAYRSLADFTVCVLMLPPGSSLDELRRAAARYGMVARAREVVAAVEQADAVMVAVENSLRRRGIVGG